MMRSIASLAAVGGLLACSDGEVQEECVPGAARYCECLSGVVGVQVRLCGPPGWGECVCGVADAGADADGADADADAGADAESGADTDAETDAEGYTTTCLGGYFDPTSSLCWMDPPTNERFNGSRGAGGAAEYCEALIPHYGAGPWRLPTISELRSLVRGCPATETVGACTVWDGCLNATCRNAPCDGCSNLGGSGTGGAYWPAGLRGEIGYWWSSSRVEGESYYTWTAHSGAGSVYQIHTSTMLYVRCVRRDG